MNIKKEYGEFLSSDGIHSINYFYVFPDMPKGIVQIEHGIAEHIERYNEIAYKLAEAGYAVFADDHLGHGKSVEKEDEICWFADKNGWDKVCNDVGKLMSIAKEKFPDIPFILMGHSMGSFIARTFAIDHSKDIDALVISGTGYQPGFMIAGGKLISGIEKLLIGSKGKSKVIDAVEFSGYRKAFKPNRTNYDWLTRDESVVDAYIADPMCGCDVSVGLFRDMLSGLDYIRKPKNVAKIRKDLPIYMFSGTKDPVGQMTAGVKKVYEIFKSVEIQDVSLKLYEDGRHEMLNGPDKAKVTEDLVAWLNRII